MKKSKLTFSQVLDLAESKPLIKRTKSYFDVLTGKIDYIILGASAWRKFFSEFGEGGIKFIKYDFACPQVVAKIGRFDSYKKGKYVKYSNKAIIVVDFYGEDLLNCNEIILISDDFVIREKFNKRELYLMNKKEKRDEEK